MEYMFDLGKKVVKIELVKTKVFCRYCTKLNTKCLKNHRSCITWFITAESNSIKRHYLIADGEIPPERDIDAEIGGIETYHRTSGGWVVPISILHLSEEEFNEYVRQIDNEPTEYELRCLLYRLLGKHKHLEAQDSVPRVLLLTILADLNVKPEDITKIELSWLKNVYKKWLDDSEIYLTDTIYIKRIPRSFREKIVFPIFDVSVESKKYCTLVERKTEHNKDILLFYLNRTFPLAVYIRYSQFKKVLYWLQGTWRGKEKYHEHEHPECTLHHVCIEKLLYEMIHQRLGDTIFLNKIPTNVKYLLQPATKDQLKKVSFVNATMEEVEESNKTILKITPENEELPIQISHPEHGSIELLPHVYYVFRVPYVRPGHD